MRIVNLIKKVFKNAFGKKPPNDLLTKFNVNTNNNIKSSLVCLSSIKGHHIEVMDNSIIDQGSDLSSYTYVGMNSAITKSAIGRYCSIGNNVSIGPGEHDLSRISTNILFSSSPFDELTQKECIIGHDVWIGVDSIIKRGVKIGNGAVIGANSVVTKDVPSYAIVAGSPAKILRYRFSKEKIANILASKWWEHDLEQAQQIMKQLEKKD